MTKSINYVQSMNIAAEAAIVAHEGQYRKYSKVPYVVHPARVSQLVLFYDNTAFLSAISAWLHDVLEDCGEKGQKIFIDAIIRMPLPSREKLDIVRSVKALTKDTTLKSRKEKLEDCISKLVNPRNPQFTLLVKLCDRIDNLLDMNGFSEEFMHIYLNETKIIISAINIIELSNVEKQALEDLINIVINHNVFKK